jgi:hypothetical protein
MRLTLPIISMVITFYVPAEIFSRSVEHPGQFWIGTYAFRWSVFGWRQQTVIPFENQTVRARVQVATDLNLSLLLPRKNFSDIECGVVKEVIDRPGEEIQLLGQKREFKFQDLDPIHRALLSAARELEIPLKVKVNIEISTCTLKYRAHDVVEVTNWDEISAALGSLLPTTKLARPQESSNDQTLDASPDPTVSMLISEESELAA